MLKKRIFKVILVKENEGVGVEEMLQSEKVIQYDGKAISIKIS